LAKPSAIHRIDILADKRPKKQAPRDLKRDRFGSNRNRALICCLSMISAQTRSAFVARENRLPLFRIMLWQKPSRFPQFALKAELR